MDTDLTVVTYAASDGIATITLNQPDRRNPLSTTMLAELRQALDTARNDPAVRAVILTGAGKAFCAGADLGAFHAERPELERHADRGLFVNLFLACERLGKPLVGAVNGHALAGGFGLALCCDIVVAASSATFGTPEVNIGLWPFMVMAITVRNLGRKRALQLFMTGEPIDAQTALDWGIVNHIVAAGEVGEVARQLARSLAAKSPLVMAMGREAFYAIDGVDYQTALHQLQAQLSLLAMSDDAKEGVAAFLEKRSPRFTGH